MPLPTLAIHRVASAPRIDGDLSDLQSFARGEISHEDLWWRRKPDGPADSSAVFYLAYDSTNLYAGIDVQRRRGGLQHRTRRHQGAASVGRRRRSPSIPRARARTPRPFSRRPLFPVRPRDSPRAGFETPTRTRGSWKRPRRGWRSPPRRLEHGYTVEAKIPWAVMPHQPRAGGRDRPEYRRLRRRRPGCPRRSERERERHRLGCLRVGRKAGASLSLASRRSRPVAGFHAIHWYREEVLACRRGSRSAIACSGGRQLATVAVTGHRRGRVRYMLRRSQASSVETGLPARHGATSIRASGASLR